MMDLQASASEADLEFSRILILLMRGIFYREKDPQLWKYLRQHPHEVQDYVGHLGLEMILDEAEGYAYLKTRRSQEEETVALPRLMTRHQLSYPVSLLLALLRKRMAEFDRHGEEHRLVLSREEILELVRIFLPESTDETRVVQQLDTHLKKIVDLGFLRSLKEAPEDYEVQRVLKAFVDAEWLNQFNERLAEYRALQHPQVEEE
jgi:hypothetical protein